MRRKNTFGIRKKKKNYLYEGLIVFTVGASIGTAILGGIFIYINGAIHKNEAAITTLSNELNILQEQVQEIQSQESQYKNQLDTLQDELSKYEAVVIPDSMKEAGHK